jgi:hypothetical protein
MSVLPEPFPGTRHWGSLIAVRLTVTGTACLPEPSKGHSQRTTGENECLSMALPNAIG